MKFTEQMQSTAMDAQQVIQEKLNAVQSILLYTPFPKEGEKGYDPYQIEFENDEFEDCMVHDYQGKHGYTYHYYLIKIYKEDSTYFVTGKDEESNALYEFEMNELHPWEIAAIADYIMENNAQ